MSDLLLMENVSKSFAANKVLDNICFTLRAGEVHALMGENGAGKSTAIKILGGIYPADSADIYLDGDKVRICSVKDARDLGISIIHQELMLMQHMSVAENLFMGAEIGRGRIGVDLREQERKAQEWLDAFELRVDARTPLIRLTIAQQQMVEIIRAVSFNAKIIAMDEPTSSLSEHEAEILFNVIDQLKARGLGIILVSHRLSDIFRVSDRITVLRDGILVGTVNAKEVGNDDLVRMMVGRELSQYYAAKQHSIGDTLLEVEHVSDGGAVKDVSFSVRKGEILGISGLVGAGRSETLSCIFGLTERKSGDIRINGKRVEFKNPSEAVSAGIGFVSEDRKRSGLFLKQSVRFNTSLTVLPRIVDKLRYHRDEEVNLVKTYVDKMAIRIVDMEQVVMYLSGGNQQKVLIARWLASTKQILLLDEPTRGVDVKTKQDIYHLIGELAAQGMAIVFVSSELPELLNVCDRIMVMSDGKTTGTLEKNEFDQEAIMKLAAQEFAS
ncbi:MAG: sugar ABC transporter ATP-binding protein [Planctomycetes bacterium]|nr:sugar ABC transporter ATP-binding protein [Planctomycetota bacterium]